MVVTKVIAVDHTPDLKFFNQSNTFVQLKKLIRSSQSQGATEDVRGGRKDLNWTKIYLAAMDSKNGELKPITKYMSIRLFLSILLVLIVCRRADSSEACIKSPGSTKVVPILRNKIVNDSIENLPEFCQWNRMDRIAKRLPTDPDFEGHSKSKYETLKKKNDMDGAADLLASYIRFDYVPLDPWEASMAGHPKLKNISKIDSYLVTCAPGSKKGCPNASNLEIESAIQKPFSHPSYNKPKYWPDKKSTDSGILLKISACSYFSKVPNSSCRNDLEKIEGFMRNERYLTDQIDVAPFSAKSQPEELKK